MQQHLWQTLTGSGAYGQDTHANILRIKDAK